jgi:shikimate kinase
MGVGKTTIARILAARWGIASRDTDADVEEAAGKPVSDIFVDDGEAHFRALEATAVADALDRFDGVLALGGGAVLSERTRRLLASHPVVFLNVGFAEAVRRVGLGVGRPLLMGNVRARVRAILEEREPLYVEVSDHVVDTTDRDPEAVADEIQAWVDALGEDW